MCLFVVFVVCSVFVYRLNCLRYVFGCFWSCIGWTSVVFGYTYRLRFSCVFLLFVDWYWTCSGWPIFDLCLILLTLDLCFYFFRLGISCPLDLALVTSVCYFSDCANKGISYGCSFMLLGDLFVCLYEFDFGCLWLFW